MEIWTKFEKIEANWVPVEVCQTGDHFSTCPHQLCQSEIQKKLLGPEEKSVQHRGKMCCGLKIELCGRS